MGGSTATERLLRCFKERLSADEVRALLDEGADIAAVDAAGNTVLHVAMQFATPAIASLLIERGAKLDAVNGSRERPIDIALQRPTAVARTFIPVLLAGRADASHLIKKDVPKPLQDLFPKLPSKREVKSIRVPGTDLVGVDAWNDAARTFIDERLGWKTFRPSTAPDVVWSEFLVFEVTEGSNYVSMGQRLRELPKKDQAAIEHAFREHWSRNASAPAGAESSATKVRGPEGVAAVHELIARAEQLLVGEGDRAGARGALTNARALLGEHDAPKALAAIDRATESLEVGGDEDDIVEMVATATEALAAATRSTAG